MLSMPHLESCYNNKCCSPTTCAAKGKNCGKINTAGRPLVRRLFGGRRDLRGIGRCQRLRRLRAQDLRAQELRNDERWVRQNAHLPGLHGRRRDLRRRGSCERLRSLHQEDIRAADSCGKMSDGCGGELDCGTACPAMGDAAVVCSTKNKCCIPKSCGQGNCGDLADGCGTTLHCGGCDTAKGETCGGAGAANICGVCAEDDLSYRLDVRDLTGGLRTCGHCLRHLRRGNGDLHHEPRAVRRPPALPRKGCGTISDGCGGQLVCGNAGACANPTHQTCLSNGTCCTPLTCDKACGYTGPDGCGGSIACPACPASEGKHEWLDIEKR